MRFDQIFLEIHNSFKSFSNAVESNLTSSIQKEAYMYMSNQYRWTDYLMMMITLMSSKYDLNFCGKREDLLLTTWTCSVSLRKMSRKSGQTKKKKKNFLIYKNRREDYKENLIKLEIVHVFTIFFSVTKTRLDANITF